jgi:hypothetical protein
VWLLVFPGDAASWLELSAIAVAALVTTIAVMVPTEMIAGTTDFPVRVLPWLIHRRIMHQQPHRPSIPSKLRSEVINSSARTCR